MAVWETVATGFSGWYSHYRVVYLLVKDEYGTYSFIKKPIPDCLYPSLKWTQIESKLSSCWHNKGSTDGQKKTARWTVLACQLLPGTCQTSSTVKHVLSVTIFYHPNRSAVKPGWLCLAGDTSGLSTRLSLQFNRLKKRQRDYARFEDCFYPFGLILRILKVSKADSQQRYQVKSIPWFW